MQVTPPLTARRARRRSASPRDSRRSISARSAYLPRRWNGGLPQLVTARCPRRSSKSLMAMKPRMMRRRWPWPRSVCSCRPPDPSVRPMLRVDAETELHHDFHAVHLAVALDDMAVGAAEDVVGLHDDAAA